MPTAKTTATNVHFVDIHDQAGLRFKNISGSPEQGYISETLSTGAAFFDYDNDGLLDLFAVGGTRLEGESPVASHHLFRNQDDGQFTEETAAAGLVHTGWGMGCAVGDYDNDGDLDLYITYLGPNRLYRNNGDGTFIESGDKARIADPGWGSSAAFGDLDQDGLLDLYVTNYLVFDPEKPPVGRLKCRYKGLESFCGPQGLKGQPDRLYRNRGNGTFADISATTGIAQYALPALGIAMADVDDDGDLDLYVANDSQRNLYWRNDGDWQLQESATPVGLAYSENGRAQAGMGVHAGDYNRDGYFDFVVTNFSDDVNTLYRNRGDGTFDDATYAAGLGGSVRPYLGWSTSFFDFDNDGWLDLFVANGHIYPQLEREPSDLRYAQRNLLYHNDQGHFNEANGGPGFTAEQVSRAAALADYDNDGDLDIFVVNLNDTPNLLRNDGGNRNSWVGLKLVGSKSNRDAIGARVILHSKNNTQSKEVQRGYGFQSQHDPRVLFGLGSTEQVQSVEIRWPSGKVQRLEKPPLRRYIQVVEGGDWQAGAVVPAPDISSALIIRSNNEDQRGAAVGQQHWQAVDFHREGEKLYRQGRYSAARSALEKALQLAPNNPAFQINLGTVLYAGLGQYAAAAALLEKTLLNAPQNAEAHLLLGKTYLRQHRLREATAILRQAADLAPQNWQSNNWLGLAYIRAEEMDSAATAFQRAAQHAPWHPTPHLHLSRVFQHLGQGDQAAIAQQNFQRLLPIHERVEQAIKKVADYPDSARAHTLLGLAYAEQGRSGPAATSLQHALGLDSLYAPTHHGLGRLYQLHNDLPNAIRAYERACALDRGFFAALIDLGQAYYQVGQYQRAITIYHYALKQQETETEEHVLVYANLGMANAMAGHLVEAEKAFRDAIAQDPDAIDARDGLAQVLVARNKREAAKEQWREILRRQPDHPRATAALK